MERMEKYWHPTGELLLLIGSRYNLCLELSVNKNMQRSHYTCDAVRKSKCNGIIMWCCLFQINYHLNLVVKRHLHFNCSFDIFILKIYQTWWHLGTFKLQRSNQNVNHGVAFYDRWKLYHLWISHVLSNNALHVKSRLV